MASCLFNPDNFVGRTFSVFSVTWNCVQPYLSNQAMTPHGSHPAVCGNDSIHKYCSVGVAMSSEEEFRL